jgi:multidrug resistance efflux pump
MAWSDTERLRTKLYALNMRLAELNHEMERTQLQVHQLEATLEDAQLASLFGEDAGGPDRLQPQLTASRTQLEDQKALIERVKRSQWKTRVEFVLHRQAEERRRKAEEA